MQKINQFQQTPELGQVDLKYSDSTVSVQFADSVVGTFAPGQAVKRVNEVGGIPKVEPCDADTDEVFGFINYDGKSPSYKAGDRFEISFGGNCMYLKAVGAVTPGKQVVLIAATEGGVSEAVAGKSIVGWAYDGAVNNAIFRVMLTCPTYKTY